MKNKISFYFFLIIQTLLCVSCGKEAEQYVSQLEHSRDSLQMVNQMQQTVITEMTSNLASISSSLDSISAIEQMIVMRVDEEGRPLDKNGIRDKIKMLSDFLQNQKRKMSEMEETIASDNRMMTNFKTIIAFLNESLAQKDREINKLLAEIASKNFNIQSLENRIHDLRDTITTVAQANKDNQRVIEGQDMAINEVFYIIGDKKQLTEWGVISKSGNPFKSAKINYSSIDKSVLVRSDKRKLKHIEVKGKSIKVLGDVPKDSYKIEGESMNYQLTILNAESFWSSNNKLLVIQIK